MVFILLVNHQTCLHKYAPNLTFVSEASLNDGCSPVYSTGVQWGSSLSFCVGLSSSSSVHSKKHSAKLTLKVFINLWASICAQRGHCHVVRQKEKKSLVTVLETHYKECHCMSEYFRFLFPETKGPSQIVCPLIRSCGADMVQ